METTLKIKIYQKDLSRKGSHLNFTYKSKWLGFLEICIGKRLISKN